MKVVVVGGGLAGLFTASALTASGVSEVTLVESRPVPGGITRTLSRTGFSLEPSAGSFSLPHQQLGAILDRAGVAVAPAIGASVRYVYVSGRLVTLTPTPAAVFAPVLPLPAKLRAVAEPMVRSRSFRKETLASFCRRRFGSKAGELLAWLMASGVFAGDPETLSVSAFPTLLDLEGEAGSVLGAALRRRRSGSPRPRVHIPLGGMSVMTEGLARSLGDHFRPNFPVETVRETSNGWIVEGPESVHADCVVLTTGPEEAARLVGGDISDGIDSPVFAPVAVVGLGGTGSPLPPGFGVLIGPNEGMASLGILLESSYAPERAPEGSWLVKVIVGGARHPEVVDFDNDRLTRLVISEVSRVLDVSLDAQWIEVVRHRPGIPQYGVGQVQWLAALEERLSFHPGIYVTGWGYRGVGVSALATDAVRLATSLVCRV